MSNFHPLEDGELEAIHMNVGWKQYTLQSCPKCILTLCHNTGRPRSPGYYTEHPIGRLN